jgi:hypothetical protein
VTNRKGPQFESEVRDFLKANGLPGARRVVQTGRLDEGDIRCHGWTLQAKNWKDLGGALREGVDGAMVQGERAGTPYSAAVIKRPRKGVGEAYVVVPLREFVRLPVFRGSEE